MQRERTVRTLVEQVKAIRWWIDRQVDLGRSDDEITRELPVAAAFIIGELGLADLLAARCSVAAVQYRWPIGPCRHAADQQALMFGTRRGGEGP